MSASPAPHPDLLGRSYPRLFRLDRRRKETADTWTLTLRPEDGRPQEFAPGQYSMLYVFGTGEVPISISGDPSDPTRLVHTIRAVGAVTQAVTALKQGAVLGIRGPFGTGWPVKMETGRDLVMIAGGIGLAPLRPAVHYALQHRSRFGQVTLLVGARTPADLLYRAQLQRLRARFDINVQVTVDAAGRDWRGQVGVVTTLIPQAAFTAPNTTALVCGPEIMMRFTVRELLERGLSPEHVFLSLERNMQCGVAQCGHCQLGPEFVCQDGPVFRYARVRRLLEVREL